MIKNNEYSLKALVEMFIFLAEECLNFVVSDQIRNIAYIAKGCRIESCGMTSFFITMSATEQL